MKCKLVIFDMDGTILNTLDDLADSCNYVLKANGFPEHTVDEIKYMVGNGIPKLIERALFGLTKGTEINGSVPMTKGTEIYEKVLSEYISWYENHCAIKTAPYDGIIDCLKALKAAGVKIAVNTNKVQTAAEDLCRKYFPDLIDYVAGSRKGISPKPDPAGVLEILKHFTLSPVECVYIGDSDVDIQTGKNAGMDAIGVDWGFRGADFLRSHGAEKIVFNCEELFCAIK